MSTFMTNSLDSGRQEEIVVLLQALLCRADAGVQSLRLLRRGGGALLRLDYRGGGRQEAPVDAASTADLLYTVAGWLL